MSDYTHYEFRGKRGERVTTVLNVMDKPALRYWNAKMAAAAALEVMDKKARQACLDAAQEAHEATKLHQERHQQVCDFVPDALKWLAGAPGRYKDERADRGKAVHGAAEVDAGLADVPENAKAAYKQYQRWVEDYRPNIFVRERRVFDDRHGFGGTFDLIAEVGGIVYLIDIKSSRYTFHETRLQLAAYLYASHCIDGDVIDEDAEDARRRVERTAILHLSDEGYEFLDVAVGVAEWDYFKGLVDLYPFYKLANSRQPVGTIIPRPTEAAA